MSTFSIVKVKYCDDFIWGSEKLNQRNFFVPASHFVHVSLRLWLDRSHKLIPPALKTWKTNYLHDREMKNCSWKWRKFRISKLVNRDAVKLVQKKIVNSSKITYEDLFTFFVGLQREMQEFSFELQNLIFFYKKE